MLEFLVKSIYDQILNHIRPQPILKYFFKRFELTYSLIILTVVTSITFNDKFETTMTTRKTNKPTKNEKRDKKIIKKTKKKTEKKGKTDLEKDLILQSFTKEDKLLEKIERYVDRNREKTSQEMMERKKKRPTNNFQKWDLDVLISRVSIESKPQEKTKEISKLILYIIYTVIIIAVLAFIIKFFFIWNILPQNW